MKPRVLLLDDDPVVLDTLRVILSDEYETSAFLCREDAELCLDKEVFDFAVLDLNLGSLSGVEVLRDWKNRFPALPVVFCSGETSVPKAIDALKAGAADFVSKPINADDLRFILKRVALNAREKRRVEQLSTFIKPHPVTWVGRSQQSQDVLEKILKLKGQPHLNVLILGESGTGKEVVAKLLHQQEIDATRPFVVVNMPAIPAALMESELFGVEKGAFTDAKTSRAGKFEMSDGGDIFLDEVADMPAETQAKLLRTLQEHQVERIGSRKIRSLSFRVISATNQPIDGLIQQGRLRQDLIYRLADVVLTLPPLRERREDIPLLAAHFLQKYAGAKHPSLSPSVLAKLVRYDWPGNVRQLESTIKRALIFQNGSREISDVEFFDPSRPWSVKQSQLIGDYETQLLSFERELLSKTISEHAGDKSKAMQSLGLSRATFYRRLHSVGLLDDKSLPS